jgi:hypothetical protein
MVMVASFLCDVEMDRSLRKLRACRKSLSCKDLDHQEVARR